ncbi:MAG: hypothetical protein ACTS3F_12640 [Phycisphaerales bacterium]
MITDTLDSMLLTVSSTGIDRLMEAVADNWFWTVGLIIAVVAIVFGNVAGMVKSSTRERTRREIAAYIAEGSMTPEQGERLISAKFKDDDCG